MYCFYTVRAYKKIAEVPPLQIPSFKSFENRTDMHCTDCRYVPFSGNIGGAVGDALEDMFLNIIAPTRNCC